MDSYHSTYNHEEYSMTQSPLCKGCGFPLCHYRTKSCILYMGETQAICGSCGLAQQAKSTFDFSSPFMTHTEHQMAELLYSTATKMGDKCNYKLVKARLVEEFGEAAFNRFKLTAQRDLASLDELRRIKGKSLNKALSTPSNDREILSRSLRTRPPPNGARRFSIHDNSHLLSTSISTPISRKISNAYTMHQKAKDRSMSSFSSPQANSLMTQIVKNDSGHVVYASFRNDKRYCDGDRRWTWDEYLQTILLTHKQYTSLNVILSEVLNQLDIAVTSEYYTKRENLTRVFKTSLEHYMNRSTKQHSDFASVMQETESLLLYKMDNANGNDEWRFWDGLIQYLFDLQKPVESRSPATRRSGNTIPLKLGLLPNGVARWESATKSASKRRQAFKWWNSHLDVYQWTWSSERTHVSIEACINNAAARHVAWKRWKWWAVWRQNPDP